MVVGLFWVLVGGGFILGGVFGDGFILGGGG